MSRKKYYIIYNNKKNMRQKNEIKKSCKKKNLNIKFIT